jgi:hypothetical protein
VKGPSSGVFSAVSEGLCLKPTSSEEGMAPAVRTKRRSGLEGRPPKESRLAPLSDVLPRGLPSAELSDVADCRKRQSHHLNLQSVRLETQINSLPDRLDHS